MRKTLRLMLACTVVCYAFLHILKEFFLAHHILGASLVTLGAISGVFFVISMFIFLFKSKFKNPLWKIIWFIVLLFSYYILGPIIFYMVVYEKRKTLV